MVTVSKIEIYALVITVLAAYFGYLRYKTKVGAKLTGYFSVSRIRGADDAYVSNLAIENYKDRSIVVYDIYIQLRSGAYLHLEEFKTSPLIIQAYSIYTKEYGPVLGYKYSMSSISINEALSHRSEAEPLKLVLNTNFGKINAKLQNNSWTPMEEALRSEYTMVIKPIRSFHGGISYSPSMHYVVKLTNEKGRSENIFIDSSSHNYGREFADFILPPHALSSVKALSNHLFMLKSWGVLNVDTIALYDLRSLNDNLKNLLFDNGNELGYVSRYEYLKSTKHYTIKWILRIPRRMKHRLRIYRFF